MGNALAPRSITVWGTLQDPISHEPRDKNAPMRARTCSLGGLSEGKLQGFQTVASLQLRKIKNCPIRNRPRHATCLNRLSQRVTSLKHCEV